MQNENTRNTIIFVVSAVIILIVYQFLVIEPAAKRRQAEAERAAASCCWMKLCTWFEMILPRYCVTSCRWWPSWRRGKPCR